MNVRKISVVAFVVAILIATAFFSTPTAPPVANKLPALITIEDEAVPAPTTKADSSAASVPSAPPAPPAPTAPRFALRTQANNFGFGSQLPKRRKFAVLSVHLGHGVQASAPRMEWMAPMSMLNKRLYAALNGYDLIIETDATAPDVAHTERSVLWVKLCALERWLPLYDAMFVLDADAIISNWALRLEPLVEPSSNGWTPSIVLSRDWNNINTGSFMAVNRPETMQLIRDAWNVPREGWVPWEEQSAIIWLLNPDPRTGCGAGGPIRYRELIREVPQRRINSYTRTHNPIHEFAPGDFVVHFPDCKSHSYCRSDMENAARNALAHSMLRDDPRAAAIAKEVIANVTATPAGTPFHSQPWFPADPSVLIRRANNRRRRIALLTSCDAANAAHHRAVAEALGCSFVADPAAAAGDAARVANAVLRWLPYFDFVLWLPPHAFVTRANALEPPAPADALPQLLRSFISPRHDIVAARGGGGDAPFCVRNTAFSVAALKSVASGSVASIDLAPDDRQWSRIALYQGGVYETHDCGQASKAVLCNGANNSGAVDRIVAPVPLESCPTVPAELLFDTSAVTP